MIIKKSGLVTRVAVAAVMLSIASSTLLSPALALGLGEIKHRSHIGQPFVAEIPIYVTDIAELDSVTLRSADASDYKSLGLEYPSIASRLSVQVESRGDHFVAVMKSSVPISEPIVTLLLEGVSSKGIVRRAYTVLLDPEEYETSKKIQSDESVTPQTAELAYPEAAQAALISRASSDNEQIVVAYREEEFEERRNQDRQNETSETPALVIFRNKQISGDLFVERPVLLENVQIPALGAVAVSAKKNVDLPSVRTSIEKADTVVDGGGSVVRSVVVEKFETGGQESRVLGVSNLSVSSYRGSATSSETTLVEVIKGLFAALKKVILPTKSESPAAPVEGAKASQPREHISAQKTVGPTVDSAYLVSPESVLANRKGAKAEKGGVAILPTSREVTSTSSGRLAPVHQGSSVLEIGARPKTMHLVRGSRVDQELLAALQTVMPNGWSAYALDSSVQTTGSVSWTANGQPWVDVLDSILKKRGLKASINWSKKEVEFMTFEIK